MWINGLNLNVVDLKKVYKIWLEKKLTKSATPHFEKILDPPLTVFNFFYQAKGAELTSKFAKSSNQSDDRSLKLC